MNGCCVDKACNASTCMTLPEGESCGACVHLRRCAAFFGAKPERTSCDFFPRRFVRARPSNEMEAP